MDGITITSQLPNWHLHNERVIVRADLNVPLKQGIILDDFRLQAIKPTLDYILAKEGSIILLSHIGRPEHYDASFSTKNLMPWFKTAGYEISFAPTIADAQHSIPPKTIMLVENLRFFKEEYNPSYEFARTLASLGTFYVNDAFGALHRNQTSTTLVAKLFDNKHRTIGLLVEKELSTLNIFLNLPKHTLTLIIGGAKAEDKIELIHNLLNKTKNVLLCPAIVFNFEAAQHINIGNSLVNPKTYPHCLAIISQAIKENVSLIFPKDYLITDTQDSGKLTTRDSNAFSHATIGISIGPKTVNLFSTIIKEAQAIIFNGPMGLMEKPETLKPLDELFSAIEQSCAKKLIAGGDSLMVARALNKMHAFDYISTGGGASLAYLSGKQLPGLAYITTL